MTDHLDQRLSESALRFKPSDDMQSAIEALVDDARHLRPRRRAGRRGLLVGTSTAAIVVAGSAAAAALAIGGWTAPWANDPDGSIAFELPSGAPCEYRIGNMSTLDPELTRQLREWLDAHTLSEVADVDAVLKERRSSGGTWVRDDGTEVAVGYGTAYYDRDAEYVDAVSHAIQVAISRKAAEITPPGGVGFMSLENEIHCVGREDPSVPEWMR